MRLKTDDVTKICQVITHLVNGKFELYLFGSRVSDDLKGGDIDLLLLVNDPTLKEVCKKKYHLLVKLKEKIGDQKIDLVIKSLKKNDAFVAEALSKAKLLLSVD